MRPSVGRCRDQKLVESLGFPSSLCKMTASHISTFICRQIFSRGCRHSSASVVWGGLGEERPRAALAHRWDSWPGEIEGSVLPQCLRKAQSRYPQNHRIVEYPELEETHQEIIKSNRWPCTGYPQESRHGQWGCPAHCRAKPLRIHWGKGEFGLKRIRWLHHGWRFL